MTFESVRERVVVITGASAGVGLATARAFGAEGARVALLARDPDRLERVRAELEADGVLALAVPTDVGRHKEVMRASRLVEQELGEIDVWVNNAMASILAPFTDISAREFERVTRVSYLGYTNGTRAALSVMLGRDRGVIVQVGSALAHRAIPMQSPYCGAKHAIEGFTESLRCELLHAGSNVAVTMVQLPAVNTPQFTWMLSRLPNRPKPVPPIYQPEVAARAIVSASLHPRKERWVTWSTARALLANRIAPALLDRYVARVAVDAQQTEEPMPTDHPHNLWDPVPGDFGAHGPFDDEAHAHTRSTWFSVHRAAAVVVLASLALTLGRRRSKNHRPTHTRH